MPNVNCRIKRQQYVSIKCVHIRYETREKLGKTIFVLLLTLVQLTHSTTYIYCIYIRMKIYNWKWRDIPTTIHENDRLPIYHYYNKNCLNIALHLSFFLRLGTLMNIITNDNRREYIFCAKLAKQLKGSRAIILSQYFPIVYNVLRVPTFFISTHILTSSSENVFPDLIFAHVHTYRYLNFLQISFPEYVKNMSHATMCI